MNSRLRIGSIAVLTALCAVTEASAGAFGLREQSTQAQGLGFALMEEYLPGQTENLHDYLIPTIGDVPPIEVILIEDAEPLGPFGAKGVGEPGLVPTAPAILGAIRHATGARLTRVPALPHRVRAAIRDLEASND